MDPRLKWKEEHYIQTRYRLINIGSEEYNEQIGGWVLINAKVIQLLTMNADVFVY